MITSSVEAVDELSESLLTARTAQNVVEMRLKRNLGEEKGSGEDGGKWWKEERKEKKD